MFIEKIACLRFNKFFNLVFFIDGGNLFCSWLYITYYFVLYYKVYLCLTINYDFYIKIKDKNNSDALYNCPNIKIHIYKRKNRLNIVLRCHINECLRILWKASLYRPITFQIHRIPSMENTWICNLKMICTIQL